MEEILRSLGRIEGQLEGIEREQRRVADYATSTSKRVGRLEKDVSGMKAWAAGAGAMMAVLVSIVKGVFLR